MTLILISAMFNWDSLYLVSILSILLILIIAGIKAIIHPLGFDWIRPDIFNTREISENQEKYVIYLTRIFGFILIIFSIIFVYIFLYD